MEENEQMEENEFSRKNTGSGVTGPGSVEALQVWLSIFSASLGLSLVARGLHCRTGFSLVVANGDDSSSSCTGVSSQWLLLLQGTASGARASLVSAPRLWNTSSVVVAHGLGCSEACGIFLDQGSDLSLLHWQEDFSLPSHQGSSPSLSFKIRIPLPLL